MGHFYEYQRLHCLAWHIMMVMTTDGDKCMQQNKLIIQRCFITTGVVALGDVSSRRTRCG